MTATKATTVAAPLLIPPSAPKIALNAPASELALHSANGTLWHSSDVAGENALVLLCPGAEAPFNAAALDAVPVENAVAALDPEGAKFALVLPHPFANPALPAAANGEESQLPSVLLLSDEQGSAHRLLHPPPQGLSALVIDRAGIVRRFVTFPDARTIKGANLAALLRRLGQSLPPVTGLALAPGSPAPDFALRDMNGRVRHLGDLRGKKNLLLTFFPKCFTSNCTSQVSSLRDSYAQLQAAGVEVWAVSVDAAGGPKGQRAFAQSLGLPFPLIPDTGRNICLLYGATQSTNQLAARMSVFIDKTGTVRWIDKQINVRSHGADVLARVREMNAASPSSTPLLTGIPTS